MNIFRDPRWGRGQETPGEDPTLSGEYGAAFVSAFQRGLDGGGGDDDDGDDGSALRASACAKHFFAYNLENCFADGDNCRGNFDATIEQGELEDTYLPAFEATLADGRASGLMCSYNAVNGVPSCANGDALGALARGSWGFDGYVTSDCGAVADVQDSHKYTADAAATVTAVLSAGMDTDCGSFMQASRLKTTTNNTYY